MTAPKKHLFAVALTVIAVSLLCNFFIRRTRALNTALAAAASGLSELNSRVRAQEHSVSAQERANHDLARLVENLRNSQTLSQAGVLAKRERVDPMKKLFGDPKLQAQYLEMKRSSLAASYGPFFRAARVSPNQIQRFEEIIMARETSDLDIFSTVPAAADMDINGISVSVTPRPLGTDQPSADQLAADRLLEEQNQAFVSAATSLLGAQGYQQFQQYERMLPVQGVVDGLAGSLASIASQLTPSQADQLTQILANASSAYQNGGAASDVYGNGGFNWPQALTQAQAILTPAQFAALSAVTLPSQTRTQLVASIKAATAAH